MKYLPLWTLNEICSISVNSNFLKPGVEEAGGVHLLSLPSMQEKVRHSHHNHHLNRCDHHMYRHIHHIYSYIVIAIIAKSFDDHDDRQQQHNNDDQDYGNFSCTSS